MYLFQIILTKRSRLRHNEEFSIFKKSPVFIPALLIKVFNFVANLVTVDLFDGLVAVP